MATMKDVAKLAGVSVAAVSKYYKFPQNMKEATRRSIKAAIEELDYQPNQFARSLRTGKSGIIAITIPEIDNPYFYNLFCCLQGDCGARGLLPILLSTRTEEDIYQVANLLKSGIVDGIICYNDGKLDPLFNDPMIKTPMVQLSPALTSHPVPTVLLDLCSGINALCADLEQKGIRQLGYIGPVNDISSMQKFHALVNYCSRSSLALNPAAVLTDLSGYNGGLAGSELLLTVKPLPQAVICECDIIAIGVLKGLNRRGLHVPEDILLAGFDNTDISELSIPALTSIDIPAQKICSAALNMLLDVIDGKPAENRIFETSLIARESTRI